MKIILLFILVGYFIVEHNSVINSVRYVDLIKLFGYSIILISSVIYLVR